MNIGIFGGSFDPIHIGHAVLANYVLQWGGLDEVWMLVNKRNPLKNSTVATDNDRLEMVRLTVEETPQIKASDFEFHLPEPSYTYDTLKEMQRQYPEHKFHLIVGSDNFVIFDKWRNYDKILEEFKLIVYPRPGYKIENSVIPDSVNLLSEAPQMLISSTFIREAIKNGKKLNFFLPEKVSNYIENKKLYL